MPLQLVMAPLAAGEMHSNLVRAAGQPHLDAAFPPSVSNPCHALLSSVQLSSSYWHGQHAGKHVHVSL